MKLGFIRMMAKPPPRRDVALLLDHETVLYEDGSRRPVREVLERNVARVWAPAERLRDLTREGHGSALLWRYTAVGWHPDREAARHPVRGLSLELPEDPRVVLEALVRWRDWLHSNGAGMGGSLGSSGFSLLRAKLTESIRTGAGVPPPIRFPLGGRQQDRSPRPALIKGDLQLWDMRAAYASMLGRVRYGQRWERVDYRPVIRLMAARYPDEPVFVRARVRIPELAWWLGPLPVRPRSVQEPLLRALYAVTEETYPVGRVLQGVWTWPELLAAESAGCRVLKVLDVWVQSASRRPFERWLEAIWQGRELEGFAGVLAKGTGNATWGQFAITSKGRRVIVAKGREEAVRSRPIAPSQQAWDLAEWICGSVRADLYRGMRAVGDGLVSAHTDGLWCDGGRVQGWRRKARAGSLRIFNPQCLSYDEDGETRYVVAGVLEPGVFFEERWAQAEAKGQVSLLERAEAVGA